MVTLSILSLSGHVFSNGHSGVSPAVGERDPGRRLTWHGHVRHQRPLRENIPAAGQEEETRDQSPQENSQPSLQRELYIQSKSFYIQSIFHVSRFIFKVSNFKFNVYSKLVALYSK